MMRKDSFPRTLRGFEHVNRFWDYKTQSIMSKILPGEYYVTKNTELIATVLGSCVAACVRDPKNSIGAMNHFLLPLNKGEAWNKEKDINTQATRYGNFAMEHMINDVLKHGGDKRNLEFKVFGGARVISEMGGIGNSNIDFVNNFLRIEGFRVAAEDTGGNNPRKIIYDPLSGKVRVKKIRELHNDTIVKRETEFLHHIEAPEAIEGEIELFD